MISNTPNNPPLKGLQVLDDASLNKNTAFTYEEREALGLTGLLPDAVDTIDEQRLRV